MRQLFVPFKVLVLENISALHKNSWVYVEEIKNKRDEIIQFFKNKCELGHEVNMHEWSKEIIPKIFQ